MAGVESARGRMDDACADCAPARPRGRSGAWVYVAGGTDDSGPMDSVVRCVPRPASRALSLSWIPLCAASLTRAQWCLCAASIASRARSCGPAPASRPTAPPPPRRSTNAHARGGAAGCRPCRAERVSPSAQSSCARTPSPSVPPHRAPSCSLGADRAARGDLCQVRRPGGAEMAAGLCVLGGYGGGLLPPCPCPFLLAVVNRGSVQ